MLLTDVPKLTQVLKRSSEEPFYPAHLSPRCQPGQRFLSHRYGCWARCCRLCLKSLFGVLHICSLQRLLVTLLTRSCRVRELRHPAETGTCRYSSVSVQQGASSGACSSLVPRYSGTWCWLGTALLFRKVTCRVFRPIVVEAQTHFSRTHDSQIVSNSTCSGCTSLPLKVNVC